MRATFEGGLESVLGFVLVLAGLGGLVVGGAYVLKDPQEPVAAVTWLPAPVGQPIIFEPASLPPSAPVAAVSPVQAPMQIHQPEPQTAAEPLPTALAKAIETTRDSALSNADAAATATAFVQCQTPNTWFLPTGTADKPRITARFGKQTEDSPYFRQLLQEGLVPANAPDVFHPGLDFGVDVNTPLFAVADGEVISADYSDLYGKHLIIKTSDGEVLYAHLNELFVKAGDTISCSQPIGLSGATGKAITGAHLHLEWRRYGKPVDPLPKINQAINADKPDWLKMAGKH